MAVPVTVTWGKVVLTDIAIDPVADTVDTFRAKLFSVTGVPPDRQKLMGFKGGVLKDGADWAKVGLKAGLKIMLIGAAGELPKAPTDAEMRAMMQQEEQETKPNELQYPVGLANLGNTCFMNSTLQCLRAVPELKEALIKFAHTPANDADKQVAVAAGQLFKSLDTAKEPQPPFMFLQRLHAKFPQFAEKGEGGGLMQHDAEECWNAFLMSVARSVARSDAPPGEGIHQENSVVSQLFQGTSVATLKCLETDAEAPVVLEEHFQKLTCNIDKDTSNVFSGMESAMKAGGVEKSSLVLGRTAQWSKETAIKQLPYYLTLQFVRFYWRQDVKKGAGDKAKIVKPVSFPLELDMYALCTPQLKAQLDAYRSVQKAKEDKALHGDADGAEPMDTAPDSPPLTNVSGKYELTAVLSHRGRSADSGHYVAWVKYRPKPGEKLERKDLWVCYDDDKPSYVTEEDVKKLSGAGGADWHIAYLLLYSSKQ